MSINKSIVRASAALDLAIKMSGENLTILNRLQEIELHQNGVAEPGYGESKSGVIATGNWNDINYRGVFSNLPSRLAAIFDKLGIDCYWSDEWCECGNCCKLVRTSPDSYGWMRSYVMYDGELECHECVKEHPEDHLESLEGSTNNCNTILGLDPADHGYVKYNEDSYESGWYPGQTDTPKKIAEELLKKGISRFLFNMDAVGQFDQKWSVYIHSSETHLLKPVIKPVIDREHPIKMTMEEYRGHRENYDGFCLACGEVKEGGCEPDCQDYLCESCEAMAVQGLENLLIADLIEIEE